MIYVECIMSAYPKHLSLSDDYKADRKHARFAFWLHGMAPTPWRFQRLRWGGKGLDGELLLIRASPERRQTNAVIPVGPLLPALARCR